MQSTLHKITLNISDYHLEKEFRKIRINIFTEKIKTSLIFGIIIYFIFILYDFTQNRALYDNLIFNRTIVISVLLVFLKLSTTDFVKKNYNLTYFILFGTIYISLIHTMIYDVMHASFLTLVIFFFTLIPFISFRYLMMAYTITTTIFFITLTYFITLSRMEYSRYAAIFVSGIVVSGMIYREKLETERLSFLKTKWSQEKNTKLEKDKVLLQNQAALAVILQNSTNLTVNINEFLQKSLEVVLDLDWLNVVSKGSISLTNDAGDIIMVASKDLGILTQTCGVLRPGQCLCGKAVQQNKLLFNKCVTADHDIRPDGMTPHGHYNIPLMLEGEAIGVLNLYVEHNHVQTPEEVDFLTLVADTLTSVVHRNRMKLEQVEQKKIIEDAYDNINESIEYAKRIQNSLLKFNTKCLQTFDDLSIFHLAKDIVSGDFYFARKKDNKIYVSVTDCTGHGVPGALVSTMGIQELEHIVNTCDCSVGEMMDILNKNINRLLNNDHQIGSDGMDLTLLCVNLDEQTIEYAGAKGIFYMYQNNELTQHKVDRVSIGEEQDENFKFNTYSLPYKKGDTVYLLTDGFIDQMSKDNNKRIGSKKVKELFARITPLESEEYQDELSDFFDLHMPDDQTDDITLISFKL